MKKLICACFLAAGLLSFQAPNSILWKESRKLTWSDFMGKPSDSSPYKANTVSSMDIQINGKGQEATIVIENNFRKDESWVKEKSDLLLKHEQTHFDISELWARKFRQKLKGKTFGIKTFQGTLNSLHTEIDREAKAMQGKYDAETDHSINVKAQDKWTQKINADLKSLSEFAGPTVTCKLTK